MYYVMTWDVELQDWTPQDGVPEGPYKLWELRKALRALEGLGYYARKGDMSVLVFRDDG